MGVFQLKTADYLFMKYRTMTVELMTVVQEYYPHLSKAEALRKANNQEFPFSVFKIDPKQTCTISGTRSRLGWYFRQKVF